MDAHRMIKHIRLLIEDLHCEGVDYETLEREIFGSLHEERGPVVIPGSGKSRGRIFLPAENATVNLIPVECTLFRLFLAHPEGIKADELLLHWKELCNLYLQESRFDDKPLRDNAMESLCSESKTVFYSTVSRIKKKFINVLGPRKAEAYIIKRDSTGIYKTSAVIND